MGSKFVEGRSVEFSKSYEESSPSTPIFFILSPGVDPLKDVEALGECGRPARASVTSTHGPKPQREGPSRPSVWRLPKTRKRSSVGRAWGNRSAGASLVGTPNAAATVEGSLVLPR